MDFKFAIFDLDGTMIETLDKWMEQYDLYLSERGIDHPADLGKSLAKWHMADIAAYIKKVYKIEESESEFAETLNRNMEKVYSSMTECKPGLKEYLEKLKGEGVRMCVASGSIKLLVDSALESLGISDYFEFTLSCADIGKSKTDPAIYFECLKRLGARPRDTVVFEDAPTAAKTAAQVGITVVGVYDRFHTPEEIQELKGWSTMYITDFTELL